MPRNLILAYIATWLMHGAYLAFLFSKRRKLRSRQRPTANG